MIARPDTTGTRRLRERARISIPVMLLPSLVVTVILFGGGLGLGALQALGWWGTPVKGELTLAHFTNVITDQDFTHSLMMTLYIALTSTAIAATVSLLLALLLVRLADNSRLLNFILQLPLTIPHLVVAVSATMLLAPAGLISRISSHLGLVASPSVFPLLINDTYSIGILLTYIWKEIPFITFMILAVLKNSGDELQEVGRTLKANPWQRFRFIIFPLIAPNLGAACLIVFAFTFGAFEVPYLLGKTYPLALPVWAYKNYTDVDLIARPEGIAIGLIIAMIVTCSVLLAQMLISLSEKQESSR